MRHEQRRWIVIGVAAAAVVGLVAFARGNEDRVPDADPVATAPVSTP